MSARAVRYGLAAAVAAGALAVSGASMPTHAAGQGQCAFGIVGRPPVGAGGAVVAAYAGPPTPGGIAQQCTFRATDEGQTYHVATPNPWDIRITDRFNQTTVVRSSRDEPYVSPGTLVTPDELVAGPIGNGGFHITPGDRITLTIYTTCAADQCAANGYIVIRD